MAGALVIRHLVVSGTGAVIRDRIVTFVRDAQVRASAIVVAARVTSGLSVLVEDTQVGDVRADVIENNHALVTAVLVGSLDAVCLPIRPVDEVFELGHTTRLQQVASDNIARVGSIEPNGSDGLVVDFRPVEAVVAEVDSETVDAALDDVEHGSVASV